MRRTFEKPQKGSGLTVEQHVLSAKSIARFANARGKVTLFDRFRNKTRAASPNDSIFCARRVWDQRAEVGFMKSIEDDFQSLADQIIAGKVIALDPTQKVIADAFYALWRSRAEHRTAASDPIRLKNVTGYQWTKDQEEEFERHGCLFIREGGKMPDRFLCGFRIQWEIDALLPDLSKADWGIVRALAGHLVVPDHPGATPIIPLTPTLCLCWGQTGTASVTWQQVAVINRYLNLAAHQYLFAHDLAQCPLNPQAASPETWQAP
jgi:hypothetical protein